MTHIFLFVKKMTYLFFLVNKMTHIYFFSCQKMTYLFFGSKMTYLNMGEHIMKRAKSPGPEAQTEKSMKCQSQSNAASTEIIQHKS